ncbi:hypothetical protein ASE12_04745 [Aeromicrobium sp. Root236]|uniref:hypothetical protein n=1 Tax=Aeromicrobium sp. Root236 TaxID=1736498 RepID=UPI0007022E9A|nr:hypothetical protein [Aeromicrobium sp. Root236]KRC64132.1 hypothetical protein ASE12_04745 [Aeromicrobium sp. Root236]
MPSAEYDATPKEVRNFALVQIGMVAAFLVALFFLFGGSDADYPPAWLAVALVVPIAVGAFFAERVWLRASPLSPETPPHELRNEAIGVFAAQTVRKFFYCFFAMIIPACAVTFAGDYGGWPLVIAGFPGLAVIGWETWPTLRNTSMTAAMLDSQGAESHLVESFLDA